MRWKATTATHFSLLWTRKWREREKRAFRILILQIHFYHFTSCSVVIIWILFHRKCNLKMVSIFYFNTQNKKKYFVVADGNSNSTIFIKILLLALTNTTNCSECKWIKKNRHKYNVWLNLLYTNYLPITMFSFFYCATHTHTTFTLKRIRMK